MKVVASLLFLAASCTAFSAVNHKSASSSASSAAATAGITRRDILNNGVASVALISTSLVIGPSSSNAASSSKGDGDVIPPYINGIYSDPNHKGGYRVVRVIDKSNAIVTLQDAVDGPIVSVSGKIKSSKKEGTTLTLDLSKKGGPKNVVAKLSGSNHLTFSDGNSWTKVSGVDGIYSDPMHPTGYRIVREGKDGKVYITLADEPKGKVVDLIGTKRVGGGYINIDFSPKGGPKDLQAIAKVGKLVFPDGNAWVKL